MASVGIGGSRGPDDFMTLRAIRRNERGLLEQEPDHASRLSGGFDFTPFFSKYVYGNDKLPLRTESDQVALHV